MRKAASNEEQEGWCLQQWLECRGACGLPSLSVLANRPADFRGDRLLSGPSGTIGAEITRVIDGELAAAEEAAWNFIERDLAPRLKGHLPGVVVAHPYIRRRWRIDQ